MGKQKNKSIQTHDLLEENCERQRPQLLETVYRQLDHRIHDLDYLQWLQKNNVRYTLCIAVLVALLSASAVWEMEDSPEVEAPAANAAMVSDAIAGQQVPTLSVEEAAQPEKPQIDEAPIQPEKVQAEVPESSPQQSTCFNPLHLAGYRAPCNGMLVYNYGLGYDPVYGDYRFHKELCYEQGDGVVFSCVDGVIAEVQLGEQWQLTVQTENGAVQYRGLVSSVAGQGTAVRAGEQIGTAEGNVYIRAIKTK